MVGNLNNAHLNCDLSYTKIRSVMVETKAIYISKVSNHINVNMDRYKETDKNNDNTEQALVQFSASMY